jgi:hypothetical protein
MSNASTIEPGYFIRRVSPDHAVVMKGDFSTEPFSIVAKYNVRNGICECAGFKHRLHCRHVEMLRSKPHGVDRLVARSIAIELIDEWSQAFSSIVFDDYEFLDVDEAIVGTIKLRAAGKPVIIDGAEYRVIRGMHGGVMVDLRIGS